MIEIELHEQVFVDVDKIKIDGDNPNVLDESQKAALRLSMEKYGYIGPIVVDKNLMLADGEHRLEAYKKHGMKNIPAYIMDFKTDEHRRVFRQVANKLRGTHDVLLDAKEYAKIIDAGLKDDFTKLTAQNDDEINRILRSIDKTIPEMNKMFDENIQVTNKCPKCSYEW